MWAKRSEMLAPLSDLVGECGETKTTRKKQGKKETLALGFDSSNSI
jgi:hypothetical protein